LAACGSREGGQRWREAAGGGWPSPIKVNGGQQLLAAAADDKLWYWQGGAIEWVNGIVWVCWRWLGANGGGGGGRQSKAAGGAL
jgi:hypothetical protein